MRVRGERTTERACRVARAIELLSGVGGVLAGVAAGGLCLLVAAGVFARYVLGKPLLGADEVIGYLMAGIIFLGLAYALSKGAHILVDTVTARLSARPRHILGLAMDVVGLGWAVPLLVGCWQVWYRNFRYGVTAHGTLQVPLWIPSSLLVIGAVLLVLQLGAEILKGYVALKAQSATPGQPGPG